MNGPDDVYVERMGRIEWMGDGTAEGGLSRPSAFGYVRAKVSQHSRTVASCSCPDCDGARGGNGRRRTVALRRPHSPMTTAELRAANFA